MPLGPAAFWSTQRISFRVGGPLVTSTRSFRRFCHGLSSSIPPESRPLTLDSALPLGTAHCFPPIQPDALPQIRAQQLAVPLSGHCAFARVFMFMFMGSDLEQ